MQNATASCLVFLCTYNGEKYLREQIESILNQKDVNVFICAADDCSTDGTVQILEEYSQKYANVSYSVNQTNKRFAYNFLDLIFSAKDTEYDYYALSDQDDVWLEDKLIRAINQIEGKERTTQNGVLYCSNQNLVDSELNFLRLSYEVPPLSQRKYQFLCENIATGCTCVFDKAFLKHFCKYYPKDLNLHDYFLFLVSVFSADYIYDHEAYINYRQHGTNTLGAIGGVKRKSPLARLKERFRVKYSHKTFARELLIGFSDDIGEEDKKYIRIMSEYQDGFFKKLKFFFCWKIRPRKGGVKYKVYALFNKV